MTGNDDLKVGISILEDVERELNSIYGDGIAWGALTSVEGIDSIGITKRLTDKVKSAMKKIGDFQQGQAYAAFLQGRIYAVGANTFGGSRIRLKCMEQYELAINLGFDEAQAKYFMAKHKDSWDRKKVAIELYERVVELSGVDSDIGMDSAKRISELQAKKGLCFIATAVFDSYDSPEVLVLRHYRDDVLSESLIGRLLIQLYYKLSPPIANYIGQRPTIKLFVRDNLLLPLVKKIGKRR